MSEQTLDPQAEPTNHHRGPERRSSLRYACALKTLCQTDTARLEDVWWCGTVVDISVNGMRLVVRRQFEPGTQLVVEPLARQDEFQTLVVRVIWATRQARGGWLLGCEVVSQPDGQSGTIPQSALPVQSTGK